MVDQIKPKGKPLSMKKEIKKEIADKIEAALSDIKTKIGDKEFHHRIKKASKIIAQGLHGEKKIKKLNSTQTVPVVKSAAKKSAITKKVKKTVAKKSS